MVSLSFDIGTTNIKSMVAQGDAVLDVSSFRLKTDHEGLRMTQDASVILAYIKKRLRAVDAEWGLESLTLVTAMHTLVLLDDQYHPIEPMLLWSDNRGEVLHDMPPKEALRAYFKTGTPVHPMSPYIKLQTFDASTIERCYIADLKSYLMVHLCGEYITDISSASSSGLFNLHHKAWDKALLNQCHVKIHQLPQVKNCEYTTVTQGFDHTYTVMIGSTDGVMANVGVQQSKGQCVLSVGTSVGVRTLSDVPVLDSKGKTFCYCAPNGQWLIGNASNNGGNLYEFIRDTLYYGSLTFESFVDLIVSDIPKSFAAPYVYGERGPFWIKHLRHQYFTHHATNDDKARALIYGLFTNIYLLKESIEPNLSHEPICLTGGFLNDKQLVQRLADYCAHDVIIIDDENAVCIAAMRALTGFNLTQATQLIKYQKNDALLNYRTASCEAILTYVNQIKGVL